MDSFKKLYKIISVCMVVALFLMNCDMAVLANNMRGQERKNHQNGWSISENDADADRVADLDAENEDGIRIEGLGPKKDYEVVVEDNAFLFPEGSPSITFERYPTQGKKASELLPDYLRLSLPL